VRVALVAVVALLALAGCGGGGTPTVDKDKLADSISDDLERQTGQRPHKITCPGDLKGEVGETVRCELTAQGKTLGVTVEVTDVDGTDVAYSVQVDEDADSGS
jgi:uncharacterized protein DUF4333